MIPSTPSVGGALDIPSPPARPVWLPAQGGCADLIAGHDWPGTPLGPIEAWPPSLTAMVGMALRSATPMAVLWGDQGIAIYNDGFASLIGRRHPGAMGRSCLDVVTDLMGFDTEVLRSCLAGGTRSVTAQEMTLDRHGTPEPAWFDLECVPVPGVDGRPTGVLATVRDVSDRVRAEHRRTEEIERLRALADNLPNTTAFQVETTRDLSERRFIYLSTSSGPLFGVSPDAARTDPLFWTNLFHPEDAARVLREEARAARYLSTLDVEFRIRRPDGQMVLGRLLTRPREASDGRLLWDGMLIDVTAVRGAEAELRRTSSLLAAIGAATPDLVYAKDRDSRLLYANAALAALLGRSPAELIGSSEQDWSANPREGEAIRANDIRIMETGETVEFEEVFTGVDGQTRHFRTVKSPLRDGRGDIVGLVGLSGDITETRQAQEALRRLNSELEERVAEALAERKVWADVFETTDAFVAVVGLDMRILAINRACVQEIGKLGGRKPRVGDRMPDLYSSQPDIARAAEALWQRALTGEAFAVTQDFVAADGQATSYELRHGPLRDRGGHLIGAYQYGTDVTDRLRDQRRAAEAEAAHREADALYRAYFQNSDEGLFIIAVLGDDLFSIEEVNPAHKQTLKLDLEGLRGRPLEEQLPAGVAEAVAVNYRRAIETGQVQRYREDVDLGGSLRHYETVLVPVRDLEGRITRLVGSSRDMTAQIKAEEALRQSQKLESMGQLTGGVAHDFNNLLTPILASLDMLHRRGVGDVRMGRLVEGALQSAERARTLVQRLLAFARRQPLQSEPIDLGALVTGMAELIASTVGPRISVETAIEPGLPPVQADANQLEMAILNLAVNARDAMPGGGSLRVAARAGLAAEGPSILPSAGRFVRLGVSDSGVGMDGATLARAIEPFFSTKGVGRGTGLGLSMVHGLASQLGGALAIQSHPGRGTTVELWLPQSVQAVAEPQVPEDGLTAPSAGTALLVDDEDLVRASTAHMLVDMGYDVVEAATADAALDLVDEGLRPDLVVTDHLMPGMTGTALAHMLGQRFPDLSILVISGYAEDGGIAADLHRLAKPFRQPELATALAALGKGPLR
ncbi:PAS domain-containing protein [Rubellimicrobium arenae]|uniref:PAS domain-containing protein n=1 Tax=Rubellimicrobium arenae TaxID=2817372 RepID=UPI001B306D75|nr:PAS domain-containing protein [Rubellimicrobium arenae]